MRASVFIKMPRNDLFYLSVSGSELGPHPCLTEKRLKQSLDQNFLIPILSLNIKTQKTSEFKDIILEAKVTSNNSHRARSSKIIENS